MIQIKKLIIYFMLVSFIFSKEIDKVADLIFKNEAGGKKENLIVWNKGEEFPSLGIGHFIWYPKNYEGNFEESYPKLKNYLISQLEIKFSAFEINGTLDGIYTILNVLLPFSETKTAMILFHLDMKGIAVSRGSACQSGSIKPSHVLAEFLSPEEAKKPSLRISFSHFNTKEDVDLLIEALKTA